jgi:hypothetical protein
MGETIKWTGASIGAEFFTVEEGHEFLVKLDKPLEKPEIQFTLQTKGIVAYPQPSLVEAFSGQTECDGVEIGLVTDTDVYDIHGNIMIHRPENVVDSIAVYYLNHPVNCAGGKSYRNGKAFHIYRIRVTDSNGIKRWGKQVIDIKTGTYIVSWDDTDLVYPIQIDPTFGDTTYGGSDHHVGGASLVWIHKMMSTPASNGTLTSIAFYGGSGSGNITTYPCLYGDGDGTNNALLAGTYGSDGQTCDNSHDWRSMNLSYGSITASTTYYLGVGCTYQISMYYDDRIGGQYYYSYPGTFQNPYSKAGGTAGREYSIYGTYTDFPAGIGNGYLTQDYWAAGLWQSKTYQYWAKYGTGGSSPSFIPGIMRHRFIPDFMGGRN